MRNFRNCGKRIRLKSQICECPTLGCCTTAWKVFLDYIDQLGTAGRLRDNAMSFDATTISRFFRRDKCSYEDDRHAVQCPVGSNLGGDFRAVSFGHDQIQKNEIRFEAARGF